MSADGGSTYLDSSALVKLVVVEAQTSALVGHLRGRGGLVSSALASVEVIRAVRKVAAARVPTARQALRELDLMPLDEASLRAAADLEGESVRSLDAIHVAAALSLSDDLSELITYDHRMASAATGLGLPVISPA
jgi:predicted nucleic acid-binding protein